MTSAEYGSRRWPLGLGLTLGAGLASSLAFLVVAAIQPPDRMATDTWSAGLEYNAAQQAHAAARARGWDLALEAVRVPEGVRVELTPTTRGAPLPQTLVASLRRERPGRVDFDADLPLTRSGGRWLATVPLPLAGHWLLHARAGDREAFVERDFALEMTP